MLTSSFHRAANTSMAAVLYHPDGAFAALAAYLYFSHSPVAAPPLFFPNTVYSPLRAEDLPLNEIDNVYFIEQLFSKVGRVVVLDHHKTALEMLGSRTSTNGNVTKVIDMDRSGATVAYDYFKEKLLSGDTSSGIDGAVTDFGRVRKLFEYIEDADLWRWRLPNKLDSVISQGMSSLADKQRRIEEVLEMSYEIALGGGAFENCRAVNADSIHELRSELGHQLACKSVKANMRGIGAVVYRVHELENDSLLKVRLRLMKRTGHPYHRNMEVVGIGMPVLS